jgi:hypothetical protein
MTAAILLIAVLIMAGGVLAWRGWFSHALLLFTSAGYALAALCPAGTVFPGALVIMALSNIGLFVAAFALSGRMRTWALAMDGMAAAGTVLVAMGLGGLERVLVYPLLLWACVVGLQTLATSSAVSGE